jgi:hypothetical protein
MPSGKRISKDCKGAWLAEAENQAAGGRVVLKCCHNGREAGDGAAAKVVAIGEAAGEDDEVETAQAGGVVPDEFGGHVEVGGEGVPGVVIAVTAWKDNDASFHFGDVFRVPVRVAVKDENIVACSQALLRKSPICSHPG